MIRIDTPENIYAVFMMRNDSLDEIDSMPRVSPSQVHGENIIHINDDNALNYALSGTSASNIHGDNALNYASPGTSASHIHGDNAMNYVLPQRPKADGILLTTTKVSASIRVADCAPVMIWAERWVMILHSGFKGTVLNISRNGLELVRKLYGDDAVSEAHAWIGPCIGRDDYERDAHEEWSIRGMNEFHHENYDVRYEKVYFDLAGEIKSQLKEFGIDEKNITMTGINTYRSSECYSYRRGDVHERMTLYAKLRKFS